MYTLYHPETGESAGELNAKAVFGLIVSTWRMPTESRALCSWTGSTGTIRCPAAGEIESTNPCGEQPLLPYESCNLGSINLSKFVKSGEKPEIDYNGLKKTMHNRRAFFG